MRGGWGFQRAGRAAPREFLRAKPEGNPNKEPCQPKENPIHPTILLKLILYLKLVLKVILKQTLNNILWNANLANMANLYNYVKLTITCSKG